MSMFNVKHATIGAGGDIRISQFKMTKARSDGFETPQQLDRFLRTKLTNKGLHTRWKRYGSWTFTDENDKASLLYAWSTSKGTKEHKYTYCLDDSNGIEAYDDLMLIRFPADNQPLSLSNHLDITQDHVKEWLECVLIPTNTAPQKALQPKPKPKSTSKPRNKSKTKPVHPDLVDDIGGIANPASTIGGDNDGDDNSDDDVLDVDDVNEEEEATAKDENILEDTLDNENDHDNDKVLLLGDDDEEEDDDDDDDDDDNNKISDDEDDDFENTFDVDMLQYEKYTYTEHNKLVKKPLLLSLWTS